MLKPVYRSWQLIQVFSAYLPRSYAVSMPFGCGDHRLYCMKITLYNTENTPGTVPENEIVSFLFDHLENYGDAAADIRKALDYALGKNGSPGGLVLTSNDGPAMTGAVIINRTGMNGYIPDNILVYIATHREYRGKGLGGALMQAAIDKTQGDIALHVEPDNPAKRLYEKLGFTNKYLEMRLKKPQ